MTLSWPAGPMPRPYHEIPEIDFNVDEFLQRDRGFKAVKDPQERVRREEILREALKLLPDELGREELGRRAGALAHEFDVKHPVGLLVCRALAKWQGLPSPRSHLDIHAVWAGAGVSTDDVSTNVLTLGLVGGSRQDQNPLVESLAATRAAGLPRAITLLELSRHPMDLSDVDVYTVETPAVLQRAIVVGLGEGDPMICTGGNLNRAVLALLNGGCRVHYHGDFDWTGLRIACFLAERMGQRFRTWRYDAASYRAGIEEATHDALLPDEGALDPTKVPGELRELCEVMCIERRAVYEEDVFELQLKRDIELRHDERIHIETERERHEGV